MVAAGTVGNQEIPDYAFSTAYSTGSYGGSSSYSKSNTANANLKWETTASYNAGLIRPTAAGPSPSRTDRTDKATRRTTSKWPTMIS